MKVAQYKSPNLQSLVRGGGYYEKNLTTSMQNLPGLTFTDTNPDLSHYLYFDPFFLTFPPIRTSKTVVTIFDLTPVLFPRLFPRGIRGEIKWQIQKQLVKTVDHIITISNQSKQDIQRIIGIPESKITTVYLAAGDNYKPSKRSREQFVLYIGDINANKNISSLLKAVAMLKTTKLILVGKSFTDPVLAQAKAIRDEIKALGIENRVEIPGFVSEDDKIKLLQTAAVYVQPSIYEGFGLPVLEAMACGCPVVCGKNSSLVEIAGDAATYADVTNPVDLAAKISTIHPTGREVSQAAKFSWQKTAEQTFAVYQKVLG